MNDIKKLIIVAVIYMLIYFTFFSKLIYNPASSYFPVYYPFCIIFGTVLMLLVNTFFVHANRKDFILASFFALILVYAVPFIFDLLFRSSLLGYYNHGGGENLLGFPLFLLQEFLGK